MLESRAEGWNRSAQKSFFHLKRSLTVPPDDVIRIESTDSLVSGRLTIELRRRILLTASWPGHWKDPVVVRARKKPRAIYIFGQPPIAIDDPARPWIVRSKDRALALALISPETAQMIDEVWDPPFEMAVWERKGEVTVVVGEIDTRPSTERLDQLIAITRGLIARARNLASP